MLKQGRFCVNWVLKQGKQGLALPAGRMDLLSPSVMLSFSVHQYADLTWPNLIGWVAMQLTEFK